MTTDKTMAAIFVAMTLATVAGCNNKKQKADEDKQAPDLSRAVATVGDDTMVTIDEMELRISSQPANVRPIYASKEKKKELLDNVIKFELMAKEAQERGFDKDPEIIRIMKEQMVSKFLARDYEPKNKVDNVPQADIEKYYNAHTAEFHRSTVIRTSEIVLKNELKAREVARAAAKVGIDQAAFQALVNKYSDDKLAKARGGDMGVYESKTTAYPRPLVDAAFGLQQVGDVAGPIKGSDGWHIIKLTQKTPGFDKTVAEAKKQIAERIYYESRTKSMDDLQASLRQKYPVKVFDDRLDQVSVDKAPGSTTGQNEATGGKDKQIAEGR